MKKKAMLILAGLMLSIPLSAQKLTVESMTASPMDLSASQFERKDLNGYSCALLKIQMLDELKRVEGNYIGSVVNKGNEKWVYLTEGSREIKLYPKNHLPIMVSFGDYGIKDVKGKSTYVLVLSESGRQPDIVYDNIQSLYNDIYTLKVKSVKLMFDGKSYDPNIDISKIPLGSGFVSEGRFYTARSHIQPWLYYQAYNDDWRLELAEYVALGFQVVIEYEALSINSGLQPYQFDNRSFMYSGGGESEVNIKIRKPTISKLKKWGFGKFYTGERTLLISNGIINDISHFQLPDAKGFPQADNVEKPKYADEFFIFGYDSIVDFSDLPSSQKTVFSNVSQIEYGYFSLEEGVNELGLVGAPVFRIATNGRYQVVGVHVGNFEGHIRIQPLKKSQSDFLTFKVKGIPFTMVHVEGGTFSMGSIEKGADDDERPVHQVTLSDYYIGETEVTRELWNAVMGIPRTHFGESNLPVSKVSWNDCQLFVGKLDSLTGRKFRLPTEAEWEFAARGGNKSEGYKYSGANHPNAVAWHGGNGGALNYRNSDGKVHAVKTKRDNELGIYDMSGNVYEWCQDWKGSYSVNPQINPTGPNEGKYRVIRGGDYCGYMGRCRTTNRDGAEPTVRDEEIGLRLAFCVTTN